MVVWQASRYDALVNPSLPIGWVQKVAKGEPAGMWSEEVEGRAKSAIDRLPRDSVTQVRLLGQDLH